MLSREDQLDGQRRRLPAIVAQLYSRCAAARILLVDKARRSPGSAEAQAHQLMVDACQKLIAWSTASEQLLESQRTPAPEPQSLHA